MDEVAGSSPGTAHHVEEFNGCTLSEIAKLKNQRDDLVKQFEAPVTYPIPSLLKQLLNLRAELLKACAEARVIPEDFDPRHEFTIHGVRYLLNPQTQTETHQVCGSSPRTAQER